MRAIFKREMRAYFASPVGYVVVAALLALYGFFYYQVMAIGSSSYITQVFSTMFMFSMMIMPIITMRSMSDDRKNKTDQALITALVSVTGIVMGKFLAAFGVYFIANTLALLPAITMGFFSSAFPRSLLRKGSVSYSSLCSSLSSSGGFPPCGRSGTQTQPPR